jgi:hypothetical protein
MMDRAPITRQRSPWTKRDGMAAPVLPYGATEITAWERRVTDGWLTAIVALEPAGWHASVSWAPTGRRQSLRYPTWDELADARDQLLPADLGFVMHLPPAGEYVALHDTCFHLHEHPERTQL